jgi:hypothetical protein
MITNKEFLKNELKFILKRLNELHPFVTFKILAHENNYYTLIGIDKNTFESVLYYTFSLTKKHLNELKKISKTLN